MTNSTIRIVTLAACSVALIAAFSFTSALAAGGGGGGGGGGGSDYNVMDPRSSVYPPSAYPPSAYPQRSGTKATHAPKAKKANQSLFDDPAFAHGYRTAYSTIYDRNNMLCDRAVEGARPTITQCNLIGYSYRKLGDYKLSQVWYERALKADPIMLAACNITVVADQQGNRDQAQYHLSRIAAICGTDCESIGRWPPRRRNLRHRPVY